MAQYVNTLPSLRAWPEFIPKDPQVEGKNWVPFFALISTCVIAYLYPHIYIYSYKKEINVIKIITQCDCDFNKTIQKQTGR